MDTGFQNKHVIVTGASSGIGFDSTSCFLAEGAWLWWPELLLAWTQNGEGTFLADFLSATGERNDAS